MAVLPTEAMRAGGIRMAEKRTTYKIKEFGDKGKVIISEEIITVVAALAATEVEGIASLAGNITHDQVGKVGAKNLSKSMKVSVVDDAVSVDANLMMEYGKNIIKTSQNVQEKIRTSIESMTGMSVSDVNVHIAGVEMDAQTQQYTG